MPNIPVTWLDEITVNTTTAGNQIDPEITQLANGNILVSWTTSSDTGVSDAPGTDVVGQIFDAGGTRIGGEFLINKSFSDDNEANSDLAALPNGGFVVVYEDVDASGKSVRLQEFDANGNVVSASTTVAAHSGTADYSNARVAVSSATSVMITYDLADGATHNVVAKVYDTTTNTYSGELGVATNTASSDVTVLSNGNYAIASTAPNSGDEAIVYRILDSAGGNVKGATFVTGTNTDTFSDNDASITALKGGGFVVSFTDDGLFDTDVSFRVYDNAGTEVGSGQAGVAPNTFLGNHIESTVAGLADGSFVIVLRNQGTSTLEVSHFSAAGVSLGSTAIAGGAESPVVKDLGDGRFAVVSTDNAVSGEVHMQILDTRDLGNVTPVYSNPTQIGTIASETVTLDPTTTLYHGGKGDDVVTESGNGTSRSYFGDDGNDTLKVTSDLSFDQHHGGAGSNTIDWSGATGVTGATFNLITGKVTAGSGPFETMFDFDNLIGTINDDIIIGNDNANILKGGAGSDKIDGGENADTMAGGTGDDTYTVDNVGDVADETGGDGTDTVVSSVDFSLADTAHAIGAIENLTLSGGATNGTGNAGANLITGTVAANMLRGGGGADTLKGLGGADDLKGGGKADNLDGGKGGDTLTGGRQADHLDAGKSGNKEDVFVYTNKHDSGHGDSDTWDQIFHFDTKSGHEKHTDKIDLSALDADKGHGGDQVFRFVDHFSKASGNQPDGQVTVEDHGKNLKVMVDVNGDNNADMIIQVMHVDTLHKDDFIL